jgi:hypothetical protein
VPRSSKSDSLNSFAEGFATKDLQEAKALQESLKSDRHGRSSSYIRSIDDKESAMRLVNGEVVTTANFAVVVRPVSTSGALAKISGFSGQRDRAESLAQAA